MNCQIVYICNKLNLTNLKLLRRPVNLKYREKTDSRTFTSSSTLPGEECFDLTIVGGGVVGTATAMKLIEQRPDLKIAIVEKENELAKHQSGHNSGVVHCGIYYKPGSLKAQLCVEGLNLSYKYFDQNQIKYKKCGKLIVATTSDEIPKLHDLYERGLQNKVPDIKLISRECIKDYEPHCQGLEAIWSPHTGIVDWATVTRSYGRNFEKRGGKIYLNFKMSRVTYDYDNVVSKYPLLIFNGEGKCIRSRYLLTCGGLHSDRLAQLTGCPPEPNIIPFRGEYLILSPEKSKLIKGNIYPVPDPRFPFLGVHFTPRIDGSVWLGPNALPAFKREGYNWSDFDKNDFLESLRSRGFQKLAIKYSRFGLGEIVHSIFPQLHLAQLRKFIPQINLSDIKRGPSGVRAQALDSDGNLVDDFVFDQGPGELGSRSLNLRNAPSPGATSSLAIARVILEKIQNLFPTI